MSVNKQGVLMLLSYLTRLGLGCLFLYSSIGKIGQPYDFLFAINRYELLGPKLGLLVAIVLPWLELLVGICLVGGIFVGGALLASIGMTITFAFGIGWALRQGLNIPCGCYGAVGLNISAQTFVRAMSLLLLSTLAYLTRVLMPCCLNSSECKPGFRKEV